MPAFRFDTLCDVLADISGRSDYDPHEPEDAVICSAWVQILPQRVQEQIEGQQVRDVILFMIHARFDERIKPGMRLRTAREMYTLNTVMDVDNRHEYLEMTATCQTRSA